MLGRLAKLINAFVRQRLDAQGEKAVYTALAVRLPSPFREPLFYSMGFLGGSGHGKSTLVNALLGGRVTVGTQRKRRLATVAASCRS